MSAKRQLRGHEVDRTHPLDLVEVGEADYLAACNLLGHEPHEPISDYNRFAAALYHASSSDELRAALEDQRTDHETWDAADFARYSGEGE